jgi:outer membrane receptor protein involved in Fe transport
MRVSVRRFRVILSLALISGGFFAASAETSLAADATTAAAAPTGGIEEIVVTAEKRSEKLKDVPIAVSVVSAAQLADQHIQDIEDISRTVPGLQFNTQGGEGQDTISIRGVSSNVGSQTVGIYLDDVPLLIVNNYEGATIPKFLDMARVEVLKGPQGTLFGAGSEGGTVRFISNLPKLDIYEGSAKLDVSYTDGGSAPNYDLQGVINVPVVDGKLALRSAFEFGFADGWITRETLEGVQTGTNINTERDLVFRFSALSTPTDDLTITPAVFFQRVRQGDTPNITTTLGVDTIQKQVAEPSRDTIFVPSLTVNDDLGFADLTSVTSYFWRQESRLKDGTAYNSEPIVYDTLDVATLPNGQPNTFYTNHTAQNNSILATDGSVVFFNDTWSTATQELRLTSKPPAESGIPIKWTVGLYYSFQTNLHRDYETIPGFSANFQKIYGENINNDALLGDGNPYLWRNDQVYFVSDRNGLAQYAVFGQADWDILPDLHAGAGFRDLYARESFTENGGGYFNLGNAGVNSPYNQVARFYAFNPKFSLTYDLSDKTSIYASAAKGFRLGGATSPNYNTYCIEGFKVIGFNGSPPNTYNPDKLWTYELGTKSQALDGALAINSAAYYTQWTQLQEGVIIPICGGEFNSNVGDAESYGLETEVTYAPPEIPGLTFHLNGDVQHSQITSASPLAPARPGEKILFVPDWTASVSSDYEFPLNDLYNAFIRADLEWTGRERGSFSPADPDYAIPQYGVLNGSIGLRTETMEMSLYVKNASNNQQVIQHPVINTVFEGYTLRPVTVGATVSKKF